MKFATFALLVATTNAVNLQKGIKVSEHDKEDFFRHTGDGPKTYMWEKQLN